jgi:hypothetical protein
VGGQLRFSILLLHFAFLCFCTFVYEGTDTRTIFVHADPEQLATMKRKFLSDSKGRLVTPALTPEQNDDLPADTWIITSLASPKKNKQKNNISNMDGEMEPEMANGTEVDANIQAQKAFLKLHRPRGEKGQLGEKLRAEETLKAMERRKRDVGVGLDRGGCTLVNEERRATFWMAPNLRMEVDADY